MSHEPGFIAAVKETYNEFSEDNVMTWAAALAFYAGLSLAPLLTIIAWLAPMFLGSESLQTVENALVQLIGSQPGHELGDMLRRQSEQGGPTFTSAAGLASIGILIFSATGVFAQLQAALNHMWEVRQKPTAGMWGFIRKRLLSLGMVLAVFFLLLVSMLVSAGVQTAIRLGLGLEPGQGWIMYVVELLVSLVVLTPLFALMYKYLPDALIRWKHVWLGAALTAVLFVIGKFALGLYLGRGSYESSYGAAVGSFLGLLVWVYYSSLIFFIGAEATQVYAKRMGRPVVPDKHAVRIKTTKVDKPPKPRQGTPSPA